MKLRKNKLKPLRFEYAPTVAEGDGGWDDRVEAVGRLMAASLAKAETPASLHRRIHAPIEWLKSYEAQRQRSLLGRIFQVATELHSQVDRVVVLAPKSIQLAIQAIQGTCCQPLWNELTRGDRGSKPRLSLVGHDFDTDSIQGLLYLLGAHRQVRAEDEWTRWGLLLIDPSGCTPLSGLFLNHFLPAYMRQFHGDVQSKSLFVMTDSGSPISRALAGLEINQEFVVSPSSLEPGALNELVLLPAAILGVNVMELAAGAAFVSKELLEGDIHRNPVTQFVASNLDSCSDGTLRRRRQSLKPWTSGLDAIAQWYSFWVASSSCSIAECEGVQHQLSAEECRFDPLEYAPSHQLQSYVDRLAQEEWERGISASRPMTRITLPIVDELHCGQLMQWLSLSAVVEEIVASKR